ncbi:MAG: hypothetical protein ACPGN3_15160 [Opitutales bacterium]
MKYIYSLSLAAALSLSADISIDGFDQSTSLGITVTGAETVDELGTPLDATITGGSVGSGEFTSTSITGNNAFSFTGVGYTGFTTSNITSGLDGDEFTLAGLTSADLGMRSNGNFGVDNSFMDAGEAVILTFDTTSVGSSLGPGLELSITDVDPTNYSASGGSALGVYLVDSSDSNMITTLFEEGVTPDFSSAIIDHNDQVIITALNTSIDTFRIQSLSFDIIGDAAPIPEPRAYAMIFGLLAVAGAVVRRRRS